MSPTIYTCPRCQSAVIDPAKPCPVCSYRSGLRGVWDDVMSLEFVAALLVGSVLLTLVIVVWAITSK